MLSLAINLCKLIKKYIFVIAKNAEKTKNMNKPLMADQIITNSLSITVTVFVISVNRCIVMGRDRNANIAESIVMTRAF